MGLDHGRDAGRVTAACSIDTVCADALELCVAVPRTIDMIAATLGITITDAAVALSRLEQAGLVVDTGGWFESTQSRL